MRILTFNGATPAEALKKAQEQLGEEALLIKTRELQKTGPGRESLYEIVVGIEEGCRKDVTEQPTSGTYESGVPATVSEAARQISKITDVTGEAAKVSATVQERSGLNEIKEEVARIDDRLKLIQNMVWEGRPGESRVAIPAEFSEIYRLSRQSGMKKAHLDAMMHLTLEHMPLKMREHPESIKRYFQLLLRKMVPIQKEEPLAPGAKKVIMLVGPTGVGKTTSIAKLAARFSFLMYRKYKAGLIVLDTYRIGAVEQLMQYAKMMKLGIETVVDPPEFTSALQSMSSCDYILIDTMGSSPYDKKKIEQIQACLKANDTPFEIEVVLVLPSSHKYEDLKATHANFSALGVDTLMFTKLDETTGFGNIFSLAHETDVPISYFSIGQEVPEDLVVASSEFLTECMLNGFDRRKA